MQLRALLPLAIAASFASAVITVIGLLAYNRARQLAGVDIDRARAAMLRGRRSMAFGLIMLAVTMPATIILAARLARDAPSRFLFPVILILMFIVMMIFVALTIDPRLRDLLQRTPPGPSSTHFESVTFDLTAEHLWKSQLQWQFRSRTGRILLMVLAPVFLALIGGTPLMLHAMHPHRPIAIDIFAAVFGFGVTTLIAVFFGKRLFVAYASSRPGILCEHTIEIRPDGLREQTSTNDTLWAWPDVREVMETPEYVLMRVTALGMFAIPKTAFASSDDATRFVSAVRGRTAARSASAPTHA